VDVACDAGSRLVATADTPVTEGRYTRGPGPPVCPAIGAGSRLGVAVSGRVVLCSGCGLPSGLAGDFAAKLLGDFAGANGSRLDIVMLGRDTLGSGMLVSAVLVSAVLVSAVLIWAILGWDHCGLDNRGLENCGLDSLGLDIRGAGAF